MEDKWSADLKSLFENPWYNNSVFIWIDATLISLHIRKHLKYVAVKKKD